MYHTEYDIATNPYFIVYAMSIIIESFIFIE
jgi:hypothetical protein